MNKNQTSALFIVGNLIGMTACGPQTAPADRCEGLYDEVDALLHPCPGQKWSAFPNPTNPAAVYLGPPGFTDEKTTTCFASINFNNTPDHPGASVLVVERNSDGSTKDSHGYRFFEDAPADSPASIYSDYSSMNPWARIKGYLLDCPQPK